MAKIAVIYYSSTGGTYQVAQAVADGAKAAGSEIRLRRVKELAPPEAIAANDRWKAHLEASTHIEEATLDDLEWADAYAFGSPTRFGNMTAQLRQFIDTTGGLWYAGKLANKAATAFTGAGTLHGGHETTLQSMYTTFAHWGDVLVPPGYTAQIQFQTGNPYGSSFVDPRGGEIPDEVLAGARWQGERLARVADALNAARDVISAAPAT